MMNELDAFFDVADGFCVDAALDGGPPFPVHYDNAYAEALDVASSSPAVTCRSADVRTARVGSAIEVAGARYRVTGIEPDGTGITVLRLARV